MSAHHDACHHCKVMRSNILFIYIYIYIYIRIIYIYTCISVAILVGCSHRLLRGVPLSRNLLERFGLDAYPIECRGMPLQVARGTARIHRGRLAIFAQQHRRNYGKHCKMKQKSDPMKPALKVMASKWETDWYQSSD